MELDPVLAVPESVVGVQHRRVLVGQTSPFDRLRRAGQGTEFLGFIMGPGCSLPLQGLTEGEVEGESVVPLQGW